MHPTFNVPVGLFCETYEKACIAKAGNFDVPVGEAKFEEKMRGVKNGSNTMPVMVSSLVLGCSRGPLGAAKAPKRYVLNRILEKSTKTISKK